MGIEPTSRAWEARILPMNYARILSCFWLHKVQPDGKSKTGQAVKPCQYWPRRFCSQNRTKTWEAFILPMNYARNDPFSIAF